ncbi:MULTISPECIES: hypothetical protein [unclassified Streptomyces]|uniref:hypothetical protein n=1 Tax=unclassified Streptomyces TaxID=2593676 RepID=UPI002E137B54|nr:hypothetical protein OG395_51865 [Streptomyces sp. NBC_01320]
MEQLVRACRPDGAPAAHGRDMLVGQPESLITCERLESAPFLMRDQWQKAEEDDFLLDDLKFVWGPPTRLSQ